jgi:hypothetical protein
LRSVALACGAGVDQVGPRLSGGSQPQCGQGIGIKAIFARCGYALAPLTVKAGRPAFNAAGATHEAVCGAPEGLLQNPAMSARLPPPWSTLIHDASGHALAYVYFEDEPGWRAAAKLAFSSTAPRPHVPNTATYITTTIVAAIANQSSRRSTRLRVVLANTAT